MQIPARKQSSSLIQKGHALSSKYCNLGISYLNLIGYLLTNLYGWIFSVLTLPRKTLPRLNCLIIIISLRVHISGQDRLYALCH